jgi:hypothetical protein
MEDFPHLVMSEWKISLTWHASCSDNLLRMRATFRMTSSTEDAEDKEVVEGGCCSPAAVLLKVVTEDDK